MSKKAKSSIKNEKEKTKAGHGMGPPGSKNEKRIRIKRSLTQ